MHGAKAPQVRNKATMRLVEAEARTLLERLGEPEPLGHPVEELLAVAAECREWLGVLREMVADLGTFTTEDHAAVERAGALVEIYERALDRTARLLVDMTKLDLESRRIELDAERARVMFDAIQTAFRAIGQAEQFDSFRVAFATAIRSASGAELGVGA